MTVLLIIGIKYNPRIHKFNEITPDQSILKIEDKTGNLVVHIPHKPIKIESEDESSGDEKMLISSSPTLSVASIFSTTSTLSSLSDLTEFEDNSDEDQIILDNIDNEDNLKEILSKSGQDISSDTTESSSLPPIDMTEHNIAMENLSMSDTNEQPKETSSHKSIKKASNKTEKKIKIQLVDNKLKLNIGKTIEEPTKKKSTTKKSIKSIKLKISPSKSEEKENKHDVSFILIYLFKIIYIHWIMVLINIYFHFFFFFFFF